MTTSPISSVDLRAHWAVLRDYLDAQPLAAVARRLGLPTLRDGTPRVCPRHECRSAAVFSGPSPDGSGTWCCPTCGALGGPAALFAAHVSGWHVTEPEDDAQLEQDFPELLLEAGCSGFVDVDDARWWPVYAALPHVLGTARGIYQGAERDHRLGVLVRRLIRAGFQGVAVARLAFAWSSTYCRPALTADELADVLNDAATECAA